MSLSVSEAVESALFGADLGDEGQVLTLSGSVAKSTQLSEGLYKLCATEACWVKQGASSVTVAEATAPAELIPAGFVRYFAVTQPDANGYVAAIQSNSAGGSLSLSRADRR